MQVAQERSQRTGSCPAQWAPMQCNDAASTAEMADLKFQWVNNTNRTITRVDATPSARAMLFSLDKVVGIVLVQNFGGWVGVFAQLPSLACKHCKILKIHTFSSIFNENSYVDFIEHR